MSANRRTATWQVEGLSCVDCAARVQSEVSRVSGVAESMVDPATGRLFVSLAGAGLDMDRIAAEVDQAVQHAGYRLAAPAAQGAARAQRRPGAPLLAYVRSRREALWTVWAGLLTLLGLALAGLELALGNAVPPALNALLPVGAAGLFAAAIVVGGGPVARHAVQELRARRLGINALMVIAVLGALVIGEWAEAAIVVVLFALGEVLEGYATERARSALDELLHLAPPLALKVLPNGETKEVAVEQLQVADRVLVRPGDRVSVDGVVRAGQSAIDQGLITGESVPAEKGPGDPVYAGTINTSGALTVEVTRPAADSTLSRMVALVREAQSRQAPVQRFIDRFARVYTPAVAAVAALVAVVPPLFLGQPLLGSDGWLMRALQMLVIACPCALVISTPVSLVSAMTHAASRGVLIKGGRYLEALSGVRVFAFDKTGTLTRGEPAVVSVQPIGRCREGVEHCGLRYAAALEVQSSHPVARALLAEARSRGIAVPQAEGVTELGGRGIRGSVDGVAVVVASHDYSHEAMPHDANVCQLARHLGGQGQTAVLVHHDGELCTLFGIADTVRPESKGVMAALRAHGARTVMLTGDQRAIAQEIARQVGVDEVQAELLPEDKLSAIEALAARYGRVAMVGDGINDAPALARAEVGIAMGGAGAAQAMETAGIVLMGDDLGQLPFIVRLSRRARRTVLANIAFALAVKTAVFALAAAGAATLWMAIAADVGASLAVILNGMRLRRAP